MEKTYRSVWMLRKLVLKSGATLVFGLVTKRQGLFDLMANERYNIWCKGELIHSNLTEEEYMDTIEDLAQKFYEDGSPNPNQIETEMLGG